MLPGGRTFPFHDESAALANAPIERVFAYLDDPKALAAHMGESSMMMMGSRMSIDVDADDGREVGSKIRMHGRMMSIPLSLEEVITERQVPNKKAWETIGTPNLLVMAHYRMGFELTPKGNASLVRVFIDYSLPAGPPGSWLGRLLGGVYARWCTKQMADGAARHFNSAAAQHASSPGVIAQAGLWSALAFALNLTWEIAHVRLYTIWNAADGMSVARALLHCSLNDVVIALALFALAGILLRSADWPASHPWAGSTIVVIGALAFTSWSEWYNVYRAGSWGYTASMPLIFGIGLSPLLQWLVLPPVIVGCYRRLGTQQRKDFA
jgi:hypothetical protein